MRSRSFGCVSTTAITLMEFERSLILQTLEKVGWEIGGPKGVAAKLGVETHYANPHDAETEDLLAQPTAHSNCKFIEVKKSCSVE